MKNKLSKKTDIPVVDVYNLTGEKVDKFQLEPEVFNSEVRKGLLHQAIVAYEANKREGNASTKTRANVRGGGKKPWRQKGTGRARAGSIRSPLWRGGGVVFGPHPRDFRQALPKKIKNMALISGLSAKTRDNEILVIEKDPEFKKPRTKDMADVLQALKTADNRTLFIYSKEDKELIVSCRNIKNLTIRLSSDFNAYDIMANSKVLFSKDTHDSIVKRFKK